MFKSILAVSEGGPDAAMSFRLAAELAAKFDAAIEAVHYPANISVMTMGIGDGLGGPVVALDEARLATRAAASNAAFTAVLAQRAGATFTKVERQELDDLLIRARTTDLMIIGRPGSDADNISPATASVALHESACPVMIAPPSPSLGDIKEIVVAWNDSQQAARAVRYALPLLKLAKSVTILVVGTEKRPIGTKRVKDWLARHGIGAATSEIDPGAVSARARGRALLSFTHDRGASMLVMGAYGRGTVMELLGLGGATAKVISSCRVPVLMAH